MVIPMHNEVDALPDLMDALREFWLEHESRLSMEFLLVDDGSHDKTFDVAWEAADAFPAPVKVLRLSPREGLGGALRAGFSFATGEVLVTYDADLPYPLSDVVPLLDAIRDGADVATASPYHPDGQVEGVSFLRLIPSRIVSWLYRTRLMRYPSLFTYTCGFRAYRRSIIDLIQPTANGFLATSQMLVRALRRGFTVSEIPSCLRKRQKGSSKMRLLRTTLSHCIYLFRAA